MMKQVTVDQARMNSSFIHSFSTKESFPTNQRAADNPPFSHHSPHGGSLYLYPIPKKLNVLWSTNTVRFYCIKKQAFRCFLSCYFRPATQSVGLYLQHVSGCHIGRQCVCGAGSSHFCKWTSRALDLIEATAFVSVYFHFGCEVFVNSRPNPPPMCRVAPPLTDSVSRVAGTASGCQTLLRPVEQKKKKEPDDCVDIFVEKGLLNSSVFRFHIVICCFFGEGVLEKDETQKKKKKNCTSSLLTWKKSWWKKIPWL